MNRPEVGKKRLETALVLLSMDSTVPFYRAMGLEIQNIKSFVATIRHLINQMKRENSSTNDKGPLFTRYAQEFIENQLGRETWEKLADWILYVFEDIPSDYPHTNAYASILTWSGGKPERWDRLSLPPNKSRALMQEYRDMTWDQDVLDLHEKEKEKPLSSWDTEIHVSRQFDDDFMDPFLWIINTVNHCRFLRAFKTLLTQLSDAEIAALWESLQKIGLENELTRISDLKNPKDLRELATQL